MRVCVRNAISKVYIGVCLSEIVLKLKLKSLSFEPIATVPFNKTHIKSILLSPFLIGWFELSFLVWLINVWLHSLVVEGLGFAHVTNVQLNISQKILIVHPKIIPVRMPLGIGVASQQQIVLIGLDSHSQLQIPTLERRIKHQILLSNCALDLLIELLHLITDILDCILNQRDIQAVSLSVLPEVGVLLVDLN